MRQFTSDELRKAWKQFYIDRGHVDVGAVSFIHFELFLAYKSDTSRTHQDIVRPA